MIYPIDNWPNLKRGFTFKELYPKSFGSLAGHPHLGLDIICPEGTPIKAWQDLSIVGAYWGNEGGNTITMKCPNNIILFRMCHLQKPGKIGNYKEGSIIGYVGNTGSASSGPHDHVDLSKNGILDIYNIENFIDPEEYFKSLNYNKNMDLAKFLKDNDLKWVQTSNGQFGRIMQGKLKLIVSDDRGTAALLDDKMRTQPGIKITKEQFDLLNKSGLVTKF